MKYQSIASIDISNSLKANCTNQNLLKSMAAQMHGRRKSKGIQLCIRAIAGEVVKSRTVYLINFCGGGQVIS